MSIQRLIWPLVALLFLGVAGLALYRAWPILFPSLLASAPLDPACDLRQGPCASEIPGLGRFLFEIEPRHLPVAQPLQLQVRVEGVEPHAVEVDFVGVDMAMGFIRPRLQPVGAGRFAGETTLPVCVRARMDWEARVLVSTDQGLLAAPFRFTSQAGGTASP